MYITNIAFEKIKEFEGCRLQAYQDAVGVWTIGYGHTYGVRQGDRISQQYAEDLLKEDIERAERQLMALHDSEILNMTPQQLDAVWVFPLGIEVSSRIQFGYPVQSYQWSVIERFIACAKTFVW